MIRKLIKNQIKKIIYNKIIEWKTQNFLVQNIGKDYRINQKKVLISYITNNYNINLSKISILHTNIMECQQIVNVFVNKGYCVDVCECTDEDILKIIKQKKYDVVFGLGNVFYQACKNNPQSIKILYATENPPEVSKIKEQERIDYYYKRSGKKIKFNRTGLFYKSEYFENIDACITVGETSLYSNLNYPIRRIYPTGFINNKFNLKFDQNHGINFLWFGSKGIVHKGLDILIEVFKKKKDMNLFICGADKNELKEIGFVDNYSNIKNFWKIDVQSLEFEEIANKCDYVILPSCSEGISTGVLTCMNHGMIPIVQKDTGFNEMTDIAYILNDYSVEYILKELDRITKIDYRVIFEKRKQIERYSRNIFNIDSFTERFNNCLDEILNFEHISRG